MAKLEIIFSDNENELGERLKAYPAVFVIADRKIRRLVAEPLVEVLAENGVAVRGALYIRTSERRKTLATVERICSWLVGAGADRDAMVLAVGGGITTDLAGFAASVYKRGVKYANVPTTLLAQVDASVGGKTGCNVGSYKNMAGVIRQPEFTFVNPNYIRSLPWSEFSAGYAELLKTFIIGDPVAYNDAVNLENFALVGPLVKEAVQIKKAIVEKDELEKDERRLLNLGHTYAHAIEYKSAHSLRHRRISHGHAVAIGIIMAARRSEDLGFAPKGLTDRLISDFTDVGLPVECPWNEEDLQEIIYTDKKMKDGVLHFVLIKDIGNVFVK